MNKIEIKEEVKIPGTDVVLEKGDILKFYKYTEDDVSIKEKLALATKMILLKNNCKNDITIENKNIVHVAFNNQTCNGSFDFDIIESTKTIDIIIKNIKFVFNNSESSAPIIFNSKKPMGFLLNIKPEYISEHIETKIPLFFEYLLDKCINLNKAIDDFYKTFSL